MSDIVHSLLLFLSMMGDSTSQDLELLMPEKSEEIIIKPETIEKFQTTEERSRLNFYFRGTESKIFSRLQNRSASVFSSEPSFSEMTEMQDFSEETEKTISQNSDKICFYSFF